MKHNFTDKHGFIANGDIEVIYEDGIPMAIYSMQLDKGASMSGCDAKLMDYIDCPVVDVEIQTINGINDVQTSQNDIVALSVYGDDGKSTMIRISALETINQHIDYPITPVQKKIIQEELGMNKMIRRREIWK